MRQIATRASLLKSAGFTLFEMAVSATIMAVLAGVLLQRLLAYHEQAERLAVDHLVAVLHTALTLRSGELKARNRGEEIALLEGSNPLELLNEKPTNYLGEFFSPELADLKEGHWYFDRKTKTLVYLLNSEKRFPRSTPMLLKYKVELTRLPITPAKPSGLPPTRLVALVQVNG